jgi:uncharacterized protein (DUF2225 family)
MIGDGVGNMVDALFSVEKDCPVCKEKFQVTRVRSRLVMIKQDSDFCSYYENVNPYYYTVWMCPHCNYAAQDTHFDKILPAAAEKVQKFFADRNIKIDLSGTRSREQAIVSYLLAIFCADLTENTASRSAGLYLRLGWLYREAGETEEEKTALLKAADYYEKTLAKENMPVGHMTELTILYMIGDLLRRTGSSEKALLYLSQVVSSPQARQEKRIADLARDVWQDMRAAARQKEPAAQRG